jgi:hypothetical protein
MQWFSEADSSYPTDTSGWPSRSWLEKRPLVSNATHGGKWIILKLAKLGEKPLAIKEIGAILRPLIDIRTKSPVNFRILNPACHWAGF